MLKRLTRKLIILSVLVVALATVSSAPNTSVNRSWPLCDWVTLDVCPSGYMCCDREHNCWCE